MTDKLPGQPGYHAVFNAEHERKYVCENFPCITSIETGRDCSGEASRDCQSKKFFDKYGDDYLILGVGAPMIDIASLVQNNGE